MTLTREHFELLVQCSELLEEGFRDLPAFEQTPVTSELRRVLEATARRLHDNFPYRHPFYLGQMLRPPHPIAQLAYALAMTINPNNHAHDGGRASSAMELEVVQQIAGMFGWKDPLGHLCSGGTVANFEALWVARELTAGRAVAASSQAHYTHGRLSQVLGVPFVSVPVDAAGRMDLQKLEARLQQQDIGTVVATVGTTGLGAVDPVADLVELRKQYKFRLHLDAAYGGYFGLAANVQPETARHFSAMREADSIVIDPHKHGLQPYGCGCVLFPDRHVAAVYHHESPYTYFTSEELHLGEISLECSRAGASAVALWATMQLFPLERGGEFARELETCREAALQLHRWVTQQQNFLPVVEPELDVMVWMFRSQSATDSSRSARQFFDAAAKSDIHLALLKLPRELLSPLGGIVEWDAEEVTCLRACLIKSEHREWMPQIIERLETRLKECELSAT